MWLELLKWSYLAACICAFVTLWRAQVPAYLFRAYLAVSMIAGAFWNPSLSEEWWKRWMLCFGILRLLLLACGIWETGYYVSIRMFPKEKHWLVASLLCVAVIFDIILWHTARTPLGVMNGISHMCKVAMAAFLSFGCLYFWSKPTDVPRWVRDHGLLLTAYTVIGAVVATIDRYIVNGSQWRIANSAYMAICTICMLAWCRVAQSYPPCSRRYTRAINRS